MHVASLELCKQLYRLSSWKETDYFCQHNEYSDGSTGFSLVNPELQEPLQGSACPAYDLGYLMRKLPQNSWVGYVDTSGKRDYPFAYTYAWNKEGTDVERIAECRGDTPEDALAKLAIELFHQGVVKSDD